MFYNVIVHPMGLKYRRYTQIGTKFLVLRQESFSYRKKLFIDRQQDDVCLISNFASNKDIET